MESCNALVNVDRGPLASSNWNRIQAKIKGIWSTFDHLFSDVIDDDASKTLIIPIVNALYSFVLVVEFIFECPELFFIAALFKRRTWNNARHPCMAHCPRSQGFLFQFCIAQ